MDLVYTDDRHKDIGIIDSYDLDMAYGEDENNFELTIPRAGHCCTAGCLVYIDYTEYGGIVDDIKVNTSRDTIIYSGRTWHGIIESKVICPEAGDDYMILSGEANEIIGKLIKLLDLSDMFEASGEDSGINIEAYQMYRYVAGYTGMRQMLKEYGGKLKMAWIAGKVRLWAELYIDYSQDEELDTTSIEISRTVLPVNHIICLGQGDLKDRAVIHIYADEYGRVQPYSTKDMPLCDDDYILDESSKVIFGVNEITQILDYPSAEITENYIELVDKPEDWDSSCELYYEQVGDEYKSVSKTDVGYVLTRIQPYDWDVAYPDYYTRSGDTYSGVPATTVYEVQLVKPSDWATKYDNYYSKSGSTYKAVESEMQENYVRQTLQPIDWSKNYNKYYDFYSDGVTSEYRSVSGVTRYKYRQQIRKPTDWESNCESYYRHATASELKAKPKTKYYSVSYIERTVNGKKVQVAPRWQRRTYLTRESYSVAPVWQANVRYTKVTKKQAPSWEADMYYTAIPNSAPIWSSNKYYAKSTEKVAPKWAAGYFKKVTDRYAVMVQDAQSKLSEAYNTDVIKVSLDDTDTEYDVGDLVGANEEVTGMTAVAEIIKKIIKIGTDIEIRYEVK